MNIQTAVNPGVTAPRRQVSVASDGIALPSEGPQPSNPNLPPSAGGFLDTLTRGMVTLTYEGGAILRNDPALAVREFATRVHEGASRGYGSQDLVAWAPYVGIGARTLILGANVLRAKSSVSDQTAGLLEKSLDVARVATDLAGVAGALLRVVSPTHAQLGTTLMGIAQSADLVSHGARFGLHSGPRVTAWLKDHDEKKARQKEREKKAEEAWMMAQR